MVYNTGLMPPLRQIPECDPARVHDVIISLKGIWVISWRTTLNAFA